MPYLDAFAKSQLPMTLTWVSFLTACVLIVVGACLTMPVSADLVSPAVAKRLKIAMALCLGASMLAIITAVAPLTIIGSNLPRERAAALEEQIDNTYGVAVDAAALDYPAELPGEGAAVYGSAFITGTDEVVTLVWDGEQMVLRSLDVELPRVG